MEKTVDGDERAFRRIYDIYKIKVFKTAYVMVNDEKAAEDIVQEVFIIIYTKIYKLKHPQAFEAWIYKIVVNACNEYHRKNRKKVVTNDGEIEDIKDTNSERQPEELILKNERSVQLNSCINSLSDKLKTCIVLFYFNGLSIKQISDIQECPENTVKSRLFKAKKSIQKKMKADIEGEVSLNEYR